MNLQQLTPQPPDLQGIFQPDVPSTAQLQQLFLNSYQELRQAVQDAGPNLFPQDLDRILEGLSERIDLFHGDPNGFIPWCLGLASDSATQAQAFITMRAEHSENVRRAIRSVISSCTRLGATIDDGLPIDPLGIELDEDPEDEQTKLSTLDSVDEIEQTVWLRVLADLPAWLTPGYSDTPGYGPATMKTRLWGFSRLQALGWRTTRLRELARYASLDSEENDD